ncbi:MAG: hypothetical protein KAR45_03755 [Desulfobacteraceae bacterium]|nr:hypothetical protein [Desulfobacteraceae bacterium]
MRNLYVFVIRFILGIVFGIVLARIFNPEWSMFQGAGLGLAFVAVAYLLDFIKNRKKQN